MASFPICPLIEQLSFLGLSDDSTPGCIIVALSKKMIIRFRLSDQKQLSCWTTKEKLTTPVYYDADTEEYFAFFNGDILSRWSRDKKNIAKSRKYQFPWLIESIHSFPGLRPVLFFKTGVLAFLGTEKKAMTVIKENLVSQDEVVVSTSACDFSNRHYLCLQIKGVKGLVIKFIPISESDDGALEIKAVRKGCKIKYSCSSVIDKKGYLISLWSDGCLFLYDLNQHSKYTEEFPGKCVTNLSNINCSLPCTMLSIDDHVIVYGADSNGEGAVVVWVDATYGVIQNSLHLKLYSNPPRIWKVGTSYLITTVGQNLTVIPYRLKSSPKLDSLLAAHGHPETAIDNVSWEDLDSPDADNNSSSADESMPLTVDNPALPSNKAPIKPADVDPTILERLKNGFSEHSVIEEIVTNELEKGNLEVALNHMNTLTDIPNRCVVDTVISCLQRNNINDNDLLLKALSLSLLDDSETLLYIREKLVFESAVKLLSKIQALLSEDPDNDCLLKWLILLMDSHYQQYLLNKNEALVNQLETLKTLIDSIVTDKLEMQEFYKLLTGTLNSRISSTSVVHYSVDKLLLY